jgi:uncharacterized protein (TIGR02598 family)
VTKGKVSAAFSLVEVTLALGVIAFALVGILALVPVAQNAGRDAADDTRIAMIEQDVFARVRANINTNAKFSTPPVPLSYYYTNEGIFFCDNANLASALANAVSSNAPLPNYAVNVVFGNNFATALPNVDNNYLKPVTASIGWPLDSSGNVVGANSARKSYVFYIRKP